MTTYPERPGAMSRLFRVPVLCLAALLFFELISLYLNWQNQAILGAAANVLGMAANRVSKSGVKGHVATLGLMLVSTTATFRYA
ncbi:MAG: hypothetical protein ACRD3N_08885 [Terracidiphilus sp.]